nr:MAG TPA: hypothetical protein [Bacteriophage sp.]
MSLFLLLYFPSSMETALSGLIIKSKSAFQFLSLSPMRKSVLLASMQTSINCCGVISFNSLFIAIFRLEVSF